MREDGKENTFLSLDDLLAAVAGSTSSTTPQPISRPSKQEPSRVEQKAPSLWAEFGFADLVDEERVEAKAEKPQAKKKVTSLDDLLVSLAAPSSEASAPPANSADFDDSAEISPSDTSASDVDLPATLEDAPIDASPQAEPDQEPLAPAQKDDEQAADETAPRDTPTGEPESQETQSVELEIEEPPEEPTEATTSVRGRFADIPTYDASAWQAQNETQLEEPQEPHEPEEPLEYEEVEAPTALPEEAELELELQVENLVAEHQPHPVSQDADVSNSPEEGFVSNEPTPSDEPESDAAEEGLEETASPQDIQQEAEPAGMAESCYGEEGDGTVAEEEPSQLEEAPVAQQLSHVEPEDEVAETPEHAPACDEEEPALLPEPRLIVMQPCPVSPIKPVSHLAVEPKPMEEALEQKTLGQEQAALTREQPEKPGKSQKPAGKNFGVLGVLLIAVALVAAIAATSLAAGAIQLPTGTSESAESSAQQESTIEDKSGTQTYEYEIIGFDGKTYAVTEVASFNMAGYLEHSIITMQVPDHETAQKILDQMTLDFGDALVDAVTTSNTVAFTVKASQNEIDREAYDQLMAQTVNS